MMRYMIAITLLTLLVPFSAGGLAQEPYVDVKAVLEVLQKGSLADREATMARVVEIEAIKKTPALAKAIGAELARINEVSAERGRRIAAGVADPTAPGIGEYMGLLVQACAQSTDPSVIDGLIGAIQTGNMATRALARFGPASFARVVTLAERGVEPMRVSGALITLDQMDQMGTLSPNDRARSMKVIWAKLSGRQPFVVLLAAIEIAVSSRQADLRERVEAIASGVVVPSIADRQDKVAELQRAGRIALDKKRK